MINPYTGKQYEQDIGWTSDPKLFGQELRTSKTYDQRQEMNKNPYTGNHGAVTAYVPQGYEQFSSDVKNPLYMEAARRNGVKTLDSGNEVAGAINTVLGGSKDGGSSDTLGLSPETFDIYKQVAQKMGTIKDFSSANDKASVDAWAKSHGINSLDSENDLRQLMAVGDSAAATPAAGGAASSQAAAAPTIYEQDQAAKAATGNGWATAQGQGQGQGGDWFSSILGTANAGAQSAGDRWNSRITQDTSDHRSSMNQLDKQKTSYLEDYIQKTGLMGDVGRSSKVKL